MPVKKLPKSRLQKRAENCPLYYGPIKPLAIDTETTGSCFWHGSQPFIITLSSVEHNWTFEWDVDPFTRKVQYIDSELEEVRQIISEHHELIFHNAAFDIPCLFTVNILTKLQDYSHPLWDRIHDTMLMMHAWDSSERVGLKERCMVLLGHSDFDEKDMMEDVDKARTLARNSIPSVRLSDRSEPTLKPLRHKSSVQWRKLDMWLPAALMRYRKALTSKYDPNQSLTPLSEAPPREYYRLLALPSSFGKYTSEYASQDAIRTLKLFLASVNEFQDSPDRNNLFAAYELNRKALTPTILHLKCKGVHLLKAKTAREIHRSKKKKQRLLNVCRETSDTPDYEITKSSQTRRILFDDAGLEPVSTTTTGLASVSEGVILKLIERNPNSRYIKFLHAYIAWQKVKKRENFLHSYLDATDDNATIHADYNVVGTDTVRFSCSLPNLQNIMKSFGAFVEERPEVLKLIGSTKNLRSLFGPRPGCIWLSQDYSQLQLRIFAVASKETALLEAFARGDDIHEFTGRKIFTEVPEDTPLTAAQRTIAKNVNFAFVFGAQIEKIEETAGRPGLWDRVCNTFPHAADYLQIIGRKVRKHGRVYTLGGYPLSCYHAHKGVNYIVQGTEAEIAKTALYNVGLYLSHNNLGHVCLFVHDEIDSEVSASTLRPENIHHIHHITNLIESAGPQFGVVTPVDTDIIRTHWKDPEKFNG